MKTTSLYMLLAATLAFFCVTTVCAKDGDVRVSQTRKVDVFHAIDITAVGEIIFTQADKYSLRIEGKEKNVNRTTTSVSDNGTLHIGFTGKSRRGNNNGVTIHLSAPSLDGIEFRGVGSFRCEGVLKLDGDLNIDINGVGEVDIDDLTCRNLDIDLDGVGDAEITVNCDHVDASMHGVGSVTLCGNARSANLSRGGIGDLDTKGLNIGEK